MEDSWELVSVPSEIQHSTINKETPDENTETSQENNEGSSKSKVNNSTCIVRSCFNERLNSGTRKCVFSSRTAASSLRPQVHTWETVLTMYGSWWICIIVNNVVDSYVPASKSMPPTEVVPRNMHRKFCVTADTLRFLQNKEVLNLVKWAVEASKWYLWSKSKGICSFSQRIAEMLRFFTFYLFPYNMGYDRVASYSSLSLFDNIINLLLSKWLPVFRSYVFLIFNAFY